MSSILNVWLLLFWFSWVLFFLNTTDTIKLFLSSEILWLILYVYSLLLGVVIDDTSLLSLSVLMLALASVEFSIGFILMILFKKIFKTTNIAGNTGTDFSSFKNLSA